MNTNQQAGRSSTAFVAQNLSIAGFGSPKEAFFYTLKELIDNAVDSTSGFPERSMKTHKIEIKVKQTDNNQTSEGMFHVFVSDDGRGLDADTLTSLPNIWHSSKQDGSIGKFGVGMKAAVLYALTTKHGSGFRMTTTTSSSAAVTQLCLQLDETKAPYSEMRIADYKQFAKDGAGVSAFSGTAVELVAYFDVDSVVIRQLIDYIRAFGITRPNICFVIDIASNSQNVKHTFQWKCDSTQARLRGLFGLPQSVNVESAEMKTLNSNLRCTIWCDQQQADEKSVQHLNILRYANGSVLTHDNACDMLSPFHNTLELKEQGLTLGKNKTSKRESYTSRKITASTSTDFCQLFLLLEIESNDVKFQSLRKTSVILDQDEQNALKTVIQRAFEATRDLTGLCSVTEHQQRRMIDTGIPVIAQSIGDIIQNSPHAAFQQEVMSILGVPLMDVTSKLKSLLLQKVGNQSSPSALSVQMEEDSGDQDWHEQLNSLSSILSDQTAMSDDM